MPSSPGYKRNYQQELKTQKARGEDVDKAERMRAERAMDRKGIDRSGRDVSHNRSLAKGGSNADGVKLESRSANRARNGHHKGE